MAPSLPAATGSGRARALVTGVDEAVALIPSGATVAIGGSGSLLQVPETLLAGLEARFLGSAQPRDLQVVHVMGLGDHEGRGVDHLAHDGLVRRFIGSHFALSPRQQRMISEQRVEALAPPAGSISLLYREIAGGRPGLFTDIGLGTYVDPRGGGGRINDVPTSPISRYLEIEDRGWIHYPSFPLDVALLRGTEVDEHGNVSMDDEAGLSDNLAIAQAVHNSGGLVIVEVKRVVPAGSIPATRVRIPGVLVDRAVLTEWMHQTPVTLDDPRRTGVSAARETEVASLPFGVRAVVARRALTEIHEGDLVNLGVGMANGISYAALEEDLLGGIRLTIEQGIFGGLAGAGLDSGTAVNPSAIVDMPSMFDLYDGGALDFAGLAFAEIDAAGDVNVAVAGGLPIGPGGFIDISQKAGTVVFCGTLRGGAGATVVQDGGLRIKREGAYPKFVSAVSHVCFSAAEARRRGQRVVYVTERAVFELGPDGIELVEIAPGIDLERDVLQQMDFTPRVRQPLALMDERLFHPGPMGAALRPACGRPNERRPAR